jgi:hypothetical protein
MFDAEYRNPSPIWVGSRPRALGALAAVGQRWPVTPIAQDFSPSWSMFFRRVTALHDVQRRMTANLQGVRRTPADAGCLKMGAIKFPSWTCHEYVWSANAQDVGPSWRVCRPVFGMPAPSWPERTPRRSIPRCRQTCPRGGQLTARFARRGNALVGATTKIFRGPRFEQWRAMAARDIQRKSTE